MTLKAPTETFTPRLRGGSTTQLEALNDTSKLYNARLSSEDALHHLGFQETQEQQDPQRMGGGNQIFFGGSVDLGHLPHLSKDQVI